NAYAGAPRQRRCWIFVKWRRTSRHRYGHPQERRWDRRRAGRGAPVLGREQVLQLARQLPRAPVVLGGLEGVHGRPVEVAEGGHERRRRPREVEDVGFARERDLV